MRAKIMIENQKALALKLTVNGGNNSQKCWELLANNVASVCTVLNAVLWASFK